MKSSDNITSRFLSVRQRLWQTARRLLGTSNDADDALQDFFVKLWSQHNNAGSSPPTDAMMSAMMRNQCIDTLRRKAAKGYDVDIDELRNIATADDDNGEAPDDLYADVRQIIDESLTELQREILTLHDMHGIEYADIAKQLNMAETAVRMNVSRARTTIRRIYRERTNIIHSKDMQL
jgi:RNA polymerase sigma-70 factor (ECF subfamily)